MAKDSAVELFLNDNALHEFETRFVQKIGHNDVELNPEKSSSKMIEVIYQREDNEDCFRSMEKINVEPDNHRNSDDLSHEDIRDHVNTKVSFANVDMMDDESALDFDSPVFSQSNIDNNIAQNVKSLTFVRETPSMHGNILLPVAPNIIAVSSDHRVEVIPSKSNTSLDEWEIEEGYRISKLINKVRYNPPMQRWLKIKPYEKMNTLQFDKYFDSVDTSEYLTPIQAASLCISNTIEKAKAEYVQLISHYGDPDRWHKSETTCTTKDYSRWPIIELFREHEFIFHIEKYVIETNQFEEDWKYTISLQGSQSDAVSDHYFYEVIFGLPNKFYPIPQATATLFFHVEVCRVIPKECFVQVDFTAEGNRLRINPENHTLRDNFLMRILDTKLRNFRRITF